MKVPNNNIETANAYLILISELRLQINNNVNIWNKLIDENSDLRVIDSGNVKSVSIDFYDDYIIGTLKSMGKVKICQLVGRLIQNIYLHDILYVYLINRLINSNKIKIILDNRARYFENLIDIANK